MKCGARVALGVAGGYFLGRTKKMKLALMLGGMAAGRQAGGPGQLLAQGSKLLSASPELSKLTEEVRGRLLDAGKGAALAVAARQVESLTDRVGKRVESLGDVGVGRGRSRGKPDDAEDGHEDVEDGYEADDAADDTVEDEHDEDVTGDEQDQPVDEEADEDEAPPPPPRRASRRPEGSSGSPRGKGSAATATAARTASAAGGVRRRAAAPTAGAKGGRPARARRSGSND